VIEKLLFLLLVSALASVIYFTGDTE